MPTIYLIESNLNGTISYKIGKTNRVLKRLKELSTGNAGQLTIVHTFHTDFPNELEIAIHNNFSHYRLNGEWFSDNLDVSKFLDACELYENALKAIRRSTMKT